MFGPPAIIWVLLQLGAAIPVSQATAGLLAAPKGGGPGAMPLMTAAMVFATAAIGSIASLAGLATLAWVGMWMGLNSKNAGLATLRTLLWVKIIPVFVVSFVAGLASMLFMVPRLVKAAAGASAASGAAVPAGVTAAMVQFPLIMTAVSVVFYLVIDGCLIVWSRRRLLSSFRERAGTGVVQPTVVPPLPPPAIPSIPTPPVI
jgi:hypothetical protein